MLILLAGGLVVVLLHVEYTKTACSQQVHGQTTGDLAARKVYLTDLVLVQVHHPVHAAPGSGQGAGHVWPGAICSMGCLGMPQLSACKGTPLKSW